MTTPIRQFILKRGNTAASSTYVGPVGEVTFDTGLHALRIHDGASPGGVVAPSSAIAGNTAPTPAAVGQIWFNTDTGTSYIYVADADSTQWVSLSVPGPQGEQGLAGTTSYTNTNVHSYLGAFDGNIVPSANVTYGLGNSTHQWKDLWVSGHTIYIGGASISVGPTGLTSDIGFNLANANATSLLAGNITSNGNVSASSIYADRYFYANGTAFVGGGSGNVSQLVNGSKTLSLNNTGFITFPNGHTYRPAIGFAAAGINGNIGLTNVYGNNIIQVRPDRVRIQTNDADTQAGIDNGGNIWDFGLDGSVSLPLYSKQNAGGVGVYNAAEFGTEVDLDGSNVISNSEIFMGTGFAEARSITQVVTPGAKGPSLIYSGVEDTINGHFAGVVSMTPEFGGQYPVTIDPATGKIIFGDSNDWTTAIGSVNSDGTVNGLLANTSIVSISTAGGAWKFSSTGNLTVPGNIIPEANVSYSLGTVTNQWRELFLSGNTIHFGGSTLSIDSNGYLSHNGEPLDNQLVNNGHRLVVNTDGTVSLPSGFPRSFTANFDSDHMVDAVGFVDGGTWATTVTFAVVDSQIETQIANIFPIQTNPSPGYHNGYTFNFTEADHGIPGYTLQIALADVVHAGSAGWTANFQASQAPAITDLPVLVFPDGTTQSTASTGGNGSSDRLVNGDYTVRLDEAGYLHAANIVSSNRELILQAGVEGDPPHSWTFGQDGQITLPNGGVLGNYGMGWPALTNGTTGSPVTVAVKVGGSSQDDLAAGNELASINLFTEGAGNGNYDGYVYISTANIANVAGTPTTSTNNWTFDRDGGLTVPGGVKIAPAGFIPGGSIAMDNGILAVVTNGNDGITEVGWAEFASTPGNVAIVGFNSPTNPGNVEIRTGSGLEPFKWTFSNVGNLTLPTGAVLGDTVGDGGVSLQSAPGSYAELTTHDGNVFAWVSDTGFSSGTPGFYISTNSVANEHRWQFDSTGNIRLPAGGDIVNSTGHSVLGGGGGTVSQLSNNGHTFVLQANGAATTAGSITTAGGLALTGGHIQFPDNDTHQEVAAVITSDTPPAIVEGSLWYNTIDGRSYVKLDNQWVDANPTVAPLASYYLQDLTVDTNTLIGTGAPDNNGAGELNFAPSQDDLDHGKFARLRSGAQDDESHIHFDTSDNNVYDIFLGDDSRYVKNDHDGNIRVVTNGKAWAFAPTGNLTIPVNGNINYANGQSILNGITASGGSNTGNITFDHSTITGAGSNVTLTADTTNFVFDSTGNLIFPQFNASPAPISSGIVFTDGTYQNTAYTGLDYITGNIGFADNAMFNLGGVIVENADLSHGATSSLLLPPNGEANYPAQLNNTYGNVAIGAGTNGAPSSTFTFGNDGGLTFPMGGGTIYGNWVPNLGSPHFQHLSIDTDFSLILPESSSTYAILKTTGFPIRLQAASKTWDFGASGAMTFPDGSQQYSGYGNTQVAAYLGDVTTSTGNVYAGNVTASNFIGSGSRLTGVAASTTGSWTLAPGANTVSFTVFGGNSYIMWVQGNIPNGIVIWNARVSISNNNVPVIGEQYGWYYVAGNALVLTSIPSQIIGTQGGISTASPAVANTNVFTFGITNNSGSSQVVNYGYTKV